MELANVANVIRDPETDVTYKVMAYRKLTKAERVQAVRYYLASRKSKKPLKAGTTVTIITIRGATPGT